MKHFLYIAAALALAGCSAEIDGLTAPDKEALSQQRTPLNISVEMPKSRVQTPMGAYDTQFSVGDTIGLFIVKHGIDFADFYGKAEYITAENPDGKNLDAWLVNVPFKVVNAQTGELECADNGYKGLANVDKLMWPDMNSQYDVYAYFPYDCHLTAPVIQQQQQGGGDQGGNQGITTSARNGDFANATADPVPPTFTPENTKATDPFQLTAGFPTYVLKDQTDDTNVVDFLMFQQQVKGGSEIRMRFKHMFSLIEVIVTKDQLDGASTGGKVFDTTANTYVTIDALDHCTVNFKKIGTGDATVYGTVTADDTKQKVDIKMQSKVYNSGQPDEYVLYRALLPSQTLPTGTRFTLWNGTSSAQFCDLKSPLTLNPQKYVYYDYAGNGYNNPMFPAAIKGVEGTIIDNYTTVQHN